MPHLGRRTYEGGVRPSPKTLTSYLVAVSMSKEG